MVLRRLDVRGLSDQLESVLPRPPAAPAVAEAVAAILAEVRRDGDRALRALTERFDGVRVKGLALGQTELAAAHRRIAAYHRLESEPPRELHTDGLRVRELVRPVGRVGCYVPGGRARYPSTVLMCATPARAAGVAQVDLCVPPGPDGEVDDATLAAAAIAGVDRVYRVGGAQAVAAMAYGTETVRPVEVIVGPGNRYVAEAMRQVSGVVGIPAATAGPSEV